MGSYHNWNKAIAEFLADGLRPGDTFYLSVDEDALAEIADNDLRNENLLDPVLDFEIAVREECVSGGRVRLPATKPQQAGGTPPFLAFLGAMVLAAYRMAPEDDIAEINYFTRLRYVLGLPGEGGRPLGLRPPGAPEEILWAALNAWVLRNGWQPSADRGPDGPLKFTNYPLSQSLLRGGDKGKLEREFRSAETELSRDADRERVGAWFLNRAGDFSTSHIRRLAREANADRFDAIVDTVYGVFTSIDWDTDWSGPSEATPGHRHSPRRLTAGLYREFNPIFGTITYHLLPRSQFREVRGNLTVVLGGKAESLRRERDGQFRPMWPVSPEGDETYIVTGDSRIAELHLPSRSFWVLTQDRFDDASGVFASWGAPRLGETFLLLCKKDYQEQLNIWKDEGLLNWDGDPHEVPNYGEWIEYRDCMVLSANWDGIIPQTKQLFDELRPRSRASISLFGGLKTGRRDSWMEGFLPEVLVTSFDRTWPVRITNVLQPDNEPAFDELVGVDTRIELPHLTAGDYWVEAVASNGRSADRRLLRVLSWDSLEPSNPAQAFGIPVGRYVLRGGVLTGSDATGERG